MFRPIAERVRFRGLPRLAWTAVAVMLIGGCARLFTPNPARDAPAPSPTACPPFEHTVSAQTEVRSVQVGDTFTVTVSSTGFAGLTQERLFASHQLAAVPELQIHAAVEPLVEVLPTSQGNTIGSATFDLRALRPGELYLYAEIYGDAYFYSPGSCIPGTTFRTVRSAPVHVTIGEAD